MPRLEKEKTRAAAFSSPQRGEVGAKRRVRGGFKCRTARLVPPHPNPLPQGERGYAVPPDRVSRYA
jgi:hypothetical protein